MSHFIAATFYRLFRFPIGPLVGSVALSAACAGGSGASPGSGNLAGFPGESAGSAGSGSAGSGGASAGLGGASTAGAPSNAGSGGSPSGDAGGGSGGGGMSNAGNGNAGGGASAGGASAGGASVGGASGAGNGSFAGVQAIFDRHCTSCHNKKAMLLGTYPALSLVSADSKAALVNRKALEPCGGTYVVPGKPDQSYLIHKISDAVPCYGTKMPTTIEPLPVTPTLSATEIATVRSWISAGAQ